MPESPTAANDELRSAFAELACLSNWRGVGAWEDVVGPAVIEVAGRIARSIAIRRDEVECAAEAATEAVISAIRTGRCQELVDPIGWMYRVGQRAASHELQRDAHHGITGLRDELDHRPTWRSRPVVTSIDHLRRSEPWSLPTR